MQKDFFSSEKDCVNNPKVNINPKYPEFTQTHFTAGDEFQFHDLRDFTDNQKDELKQSDFELKHNVFSDIPLTIYNKYINVDSETATNTFRYIFYKFKKGIFVKIQNNSIVTFLPFDNHKFINEWYSNIQQPSNQTIQEYLQTLDYRNAKHKTNPVKSTWYANNCLLRFENPPSYEDTNTTNIHDMFIELLKNRKIPDVEFFVNRRDFPIITNNETEAYYNLFDHNTPLKSHNYNKYLPILSMVTTNINADVPMPTGEDWARVESANNKYFKKYCDRKFNTTFDIDWASKIPTGMFRGSSTGCGVTIDTNIRLKLAYLSVKTPTENGIPLVDAGITKWNVRLRKLAGDTSLHTIDVKNLKKTYGIDLVKPLPIYDQTKYKYLINVDGHVSAFRLSLELSSGSCVILADSPYKMWYSPLLIPYTHYVPVKHDLSDLYDAIRWCRDNDEKCHQITINAKLFYDTYLSRNGIFDYLQTLFITLRKNIGDYSYNKQREVINNTKVFETNPFKTLPVKMTYNRTPGFLLRTKWYIQNLITQNKLEKKSEIQLGRHTYFPLDDFKIIETKYVHSSQLHHTYKIGMLLNTLSSHTPNFKYTFGMNNSCVYTEFINGITLDDFIQKHFDFTLYCNFLLQICLSINIAQQHFGFIHNNLTSSNIIIHTLKQPTTIQYKVDYKTIITLTTKHLVLITNFDRSSLIEKDKPYYRYDINRSSQGYDMFKLLASSLNTVTQHVHKKELENSLLTLSKCFSAVNFAPVFKSLDQLSGFLRMKSKPDFIDISTLNTTLTPTYLAAFLIKQFKLKHAISNVYDQITLNDNPVLLYEPTYHFNLEKITSTKVTNSVCSYYIAQTVYKKVFPDTYDVVTLPDWIDYKIDESSKSRFVADCLIIESILTDDNKYKLTSTQKAHCIDTYLPILSINKFNYLHN